MPAWNFFHSFYEIHYVYSGHSNIRFEGQAVEMGEGDLCVIAPEAMHTVSVYDDSIILNAKVRKSTFKSAFPALLSGRNMLADFFLATIYLGEYDDYLFFNNIDASRVRPLFAELYIEHYNKKTYYRQLMNQLLTMIFFRLLRDSGDAHEYGHSAKDHRMVSILDYIRENYTDVTLSRLASDFHFAEQYLSRYIREQSGMTYTDIVRSVKLEKALEMLETTSMTISSISGSVGYSSPENFMRQFKNRYGLSPTSYRKLGTTH
jgi:AraC-like DNA-binding protein